MPQDMMEEDACSRGIADTKPSVKNQPRPLTYDEKKAAEAAFRGEPFNPAWSSAAAKVYAGIVIAMMPQSDTSKFEESAAEADYCAFL